MYVAESDFWDYCPSQRVRMQRKEVKLRLNDTIHLFHYQGKTKCWKCVWLLVASRREDWWTCIQFSSEFSGLFGVTGCPLTHLLQFWLELQEAPDQAKPKSQIHLLGAGKTYLSDACEKINTCVPFWIFLHISDHSSSSSSQVCHTRKICSWLWLLSNGALVAFLCLVLKTIWLPVYTRPKDFQHS